jgi:hypothetical protein
LPQLDKELPKRDEYSLSSSKIEPQGSTKGEEESEYWDNYQLLRQGFVYWV